MIKTFNQKNITDIMNHTFRTLVRGGYEIVSNKI